MTETPSCMRRNPERLTSQNHHDPLQRIAERNLISALLTLALAAIYPAVALWVLAAALGLACSVTAAASMAVRRIGLG